jgi:hypothetical protein
VARKSTNNHVTVPHRPGMVGIEFLGICRSSSRSTHRFTLYRSSEQPTVFRYFHAAITSRRSDQSFFRIFRWLPSIINMSSESSDGFRVSSTCHDRHPCTSDAQELTGRDHPVEVVAVLPFTHVTYRTGSRPLSQHTCPSRLDPRTERVHIPHCSLRLPLSVTVPFH